MMGRRRRLFRRARTDPDRSTAGSTAAGSAVGSTAAGSAAGEPERAAVSAADMAPVLTIDALGRKCPIPIIMLADQIKDVPLGAIVAVLADDPAAYTDVPSWCVMKAHEFAGYEVLSRGWALFIRRAV
jgi:tRNA 2-thiouridine synthesizing protein A